MNSLPHPSRRRAGLPCLPALLLLPTTAALAVSPLVTDDADTVEPGRWQFNGVWDFSRADGTAHHLWTLNPVVGLTPRLEFGVTFGWQWLDAGNPAANADGLTDFELSPKLRIWQQDEERFRISMRLDLKAPTAPRSKGLGSGETDLGAVLIATHRFGRTEADVNAGYTFTGLSRGRWRDDEWFVGAAARHELGARWTLLGEAHALIPPGGSTHFATVNFNGGAQFKLRENLLVSALIGSAAGPASPKLTSYLGFTWEF